ncbi:MAG: hypothetical protein AAGF23_19845 [Acidobacteriota bacterium]
MQTARSQTLLLYILRCLRFSASLIVTGIVFFLAWVEHLEPFVSLVDVAAVFLSILLLENRATAALLRRRTQRLEPKAHEIDDSDLGSLFGGPDLESLGPAEKQMPLDVSPNRPWPNPEDKE